jgi:uncharacterized protein (TIGR02246 family)
MTRLRAPGPLLVVLLFIAAQSIALTQQPKAQQSQAQQPQTRQAQGPSAEAAVSADEQQIRQGVVAFVEQYNAHKADAVAALFAADARMVFRDGTEVNGREEVKQSFEEAFKDNPKTAVSVVVDSIRFLTPDVAVEEGATTTFPDGETLTSLGRYTVLHLKRDGLWQMQSVRVVEEESLSAYGELAPLEWLVGEWIDEGRDEDVHTTFRWDENKSFLLEEFRVVRRGEVLLKGSQRIGWDPQVKQVRSWIFDSAGGFGEATWTPAGDDWICKATGVRPDGKSASATRRLTRAAQDRVIWTSVDRLLGDEELTDLAVTMVRKAPQPQ